MRWLPGTRILTWVGDGAGTSRRASVVARTVAAACRIGQLGGGAQAELLEPGAELFEAAAHARGEHPEVGAADREHPAVEVLALELDRRREAGEDRGVGIVELVQAHEVDREALDGRPAAR